MKWNFRYINIYIYICSQAIIKSYLELSSFLFIHASTSIIECILTSLKIIKIKFHNKILASIFIFGYSMFYCYFFFLPYCRESLIIFFKRFLFAIIAPACFSVCSLRWRGGCRSILTSDSSTYPQSHKNRFLHGPQ